MKYLKQSTLIQIMINISLKSWKVEIFEKVECPWTIPSHRLAEISEKKHLQVHGQLYMLLLGVIELAKFIKNGGLEGVTTIRWKFIAGPINESMMMAATEKFIVNSNDIKSSATRFDQLRLNYYHSKGFEFDVRNPTLVTTHSKAYRKSLYVNTHLHICLFSCNLLSVSFRILLCTYL